MKELKYLPLSVAATLGFFVAIIATCAMAQDATVVSPVVRTGGVDFGPMLTNLLETVGVALGAAATTLVGFAIRLVSAKTGIHDATMEKLMNDRLSDIIYRGIDFAEGAAKKAMADPNSQIHHVKFDNFFLEQTMNFVTAQAPDLIAYFKLTNSQIAAMITSRINGFLNTPTVNDPTTLTMSTSTPNASIAAAAGVQ